MYVFDITGLSNNTSIFLRIYVISGEGQKKFKYSHLKIWPWPSRW